MRRGRRPRRRRPGWRHPSAGDGRRGAGWARDHPRCPPLRVSSSMGAPDQGFLATSRRSGGVRPTACRPRPSPSLLVVAGLAGGAVAGVGLERAGVLSPVDETEEAARRVAPGGERVGVFDCPEGVIVASLTGGDRVAGNRPQTDDGTWIEIRSPLDLDARAWRPAPLRPRRPRPGRPPRGRVRAAATASSSTTTSSTSSTTTTTIDQHHVDDARPVAVTTATTGGRRRPRHRPTACRRSLERPRSPRRAHESSRPAS